MSAGDDFAHAWEVAQILVEELHCRSTRLHRT
jgi:hypothetical protein